MLPRFAPLCAILLGCGAPPASPATNASCGGCHPAQREALRGSRHGHATESELFRALRARATPPSQALCDFCHTVYNEPGEQGAGCVTCHQAIGNHGVRNARLLLAPDGPMLGPITDPAPTAAHASRASAFTTSADLCGTCHEVAGPNGFRETPYSEWSASPAMRLGLTCSDCHMSATPGAPSSARPMAPAALGGPVRALSDHAFVGPDDPRAPELLVHAAAMRLRVVSQGAAGIEVSVEVENRNSAHALPSGARFAREVWIELSVTDASGAAHVVSGGDDGAPDPMRIDLGDRITLQGTGALPTESDAPEVRAIPAGERRAYSFVVPSAWAGAATRTVRARLRFRRNDRALRARLGLGEATDVPVNLASAEEVL